MSSRNIQHVFDVFGEHGHPERTTISEMGTLLLSRLLNLNATQTSVYELLKLKTEKVEIPLEKEATYDYGKTKSKVRPKKSGFRKVAQSLIRGIFGALKRKVHTFFEKNHAREQLPAWRF